VATVPSLPERAPASRELDAGGYCPYERITSSNPARALGGHGPAAVGFYERALGAVVEHRVVGPRAEDVVAQLSVAGARFWVSTASERLHRFSPNAIGGATGRVLLVLSEPESLLSAAVAAGAKQTSPVANEHGWRLGRFEDPFGHQWEVGRPIGAWPPATA
jgi:PhnB protein